MAVEKTWSVTQFGAPLTSLETEIPKLGDSEILVKVQYCGVCHSDLLFRKGYYDMGGGRVLDLRQTGVKLPRAPGHEIVGKVVELGPTATNAVVGDLRIVYPWIGCGSCVACQSNREHLCARQRRFGMYREGGLSPYIVVPHGKYLVDLRGVEPALASTFACSGLTAYSAVKKALPLSESSPVVVIGAGGLGLSAIAALRAMGHRAIVSVDIDQQKLAAAELQGATITINSSEGDLATEIAKAVGEPINAVVDFVNNEKTARAGYDCLAKGGRLISVGVSGGEITLSLAQLVFQAKRIEGSITGTLDELQELVDYAVKGNLKAIPHSLYSRDEVNSVFTELENGRIVGRAILAAAD